jgi:hypothetical protein
MEFAALGSNIIATSNQCAAILAFDTETAGLAIGNPLPDALKNALNIYVTAGDMLIAFAYYFIRRPYSFEVMTTAKDDIHSLCPSTDWSWKSMPAPPFAKSERIKSYALHPDGHTLFVSVSSGTFSIDTKNHEWRHHGEWILPFKLQGYFDGDLDAWVGLHPDGYICSCQVPSLSSSNIQLPDWKMTEHRMWMTQDQVAGAQGATLTYMGNSRFFLVDCELGEGIKFQDAFSDSQGCVLHMTTFRLKYNHEGKLRIIDRNTTSCPVSRRFPYFYPVAFWM